MTDPKGGPTRREVAAGAAALAFVPPLRAAAQTEPDARAAVETLRDPILRISREVWDAAEVSLAEERSAEIHVRELRAAGFEIEGPGVAGVPTHFVATWSQGTGGPSIGFLPEYDALPGLGNAAEPRQTPRADGRTDGHGCGHNALGAGCTGAGMALKAMMEASGAPGTVKVFGCASEEAHSGKTYLARDGYFEGLDAALAWHSGPAAGTGLVSTTANRALKIEFFGQTAHAGNTPWEGRSALDAAEIATHAINMMREHVRPTARLHYIFESAGQAPNIVPDYARVWLTLREADTPTVEALVEWTRQIAEGAALATQTRAETRVFAGCAELIPNRPLAERLLTRMSEHGLAWSEAEQEFARVCQREMGLPETGMATEILPLVPETSIGGSTDVGDVSWNAPTGVFLWPSLPQGVSLHTWAVTACGGMSIGDRASLDSAAILAATGWDLMTDVALRDAVREDWRARIGGRAYVNAIPPEQAEPIAIPEHLRKTGGDELDAATG